MSYNPSIKLKTTPAKSQERRSIFYSYRPLQNIIPFVMFAVTYFVYRLYIRNHTLTMDEAEQLRLATKLHWGYPNQPPLYNWLQYLFFQIIGKNLVALAALKAILLSFCLFVYHKICRIHCADTRLATCATAAWALIPSMGYVLIKDNTHSLIALLAACLTWYWWLLSATRHRFMHAFILGSFIAVGLLGKFNYFLFLTPFAISLLSLHPPCTINRLWPLVLVTLAGIALLSWPYLLWLIQHPHLGTGMAYKLSPAHGSRWLALLKLLVAAVFYALPVYLAWRFFFHPSPANQKNRLTPANQLLERYLLLCLPVITIAVVIFGWGTFKARWLICILFPLPLLFFSRMEKTCGRNKAAEHFILFCLVVEALWFAVIAIHSVN